MVPTIQNLASQRRPDKGTQCVWQQFVGRDFARLHDDDFRLGNAVGCRILRRRAW